MDALHPVLVGVDAVHPLHPLHPLHPVLVTPVFYGKNEHKNIILCSGRAHIYK
jgi:hypothetical protein